MITSDLLASSATTANVYQQCVAIIQQQQQQSNTTTTDAGADTSSFILMQCISDRIQGIIEVDMNNVHTNSRNFFLLYAASLVFFMQAGFAMLCAGSVRKKNIQNTMLKNLLDACGAAIAFYSIGYALAYGGSHSQWGIWDNDYASSTNSTQKTFMGTSHFFLYNVTDYAFWLFQYAFSAACTTIVAGALAERCQMVAYLCYSVILSGWVYPIIVHAIWSQQGFLSAYSPEPLWHTGVIDFAGAGVVHITGGMTALFATIILGPRRGRFHNDEGVELETPREFPGSSVALQMLGTFILWFGWYGFNSGNAILREFNELRANEAAFVAVNTTLAAGMAGITGLLANLWYLDRTTGEGFFDLKHARNGALSGLVAITAGCAVVEPYSALIIGFLAGLSYTSGSRILVYFRIDDAVDAIPVHLSNGILGLLMTGLLASPSRLLSCYGRADHVGLFYSWADGKSDFVLLGTQIVGLLFISGWVIFWMVPFFILLDYMGWFRSDPLEEIIGLDTSYHGGIALLGSAMNPADERISEGHLSEFKRRRLEAKNTRLRILQSLDEQKHDQTPDSIDDPAIPNQSDEIFRDDDDDKTSDVGDGVIRN